MATFEIRDLSFFYPEQEQPVLEQVCFTVAEGQFLALCGPSGCGKTTLLRQLKTVLAPHGRLSGEILFNGTPLAKLPLRQQSSQIGFVLQSPENQIVTDKVWHELAFGLESLGYDTPTIRGRVAEMASFFGIESWFYKNVNQLSGGQKQLLNLASIMAMQPGVLILDEPTSQLDPIAAADFLATVGKINRELGTTVILTEHRLEEVFPLADRVLVLDRGKILCDGTPRQVGEQLKGLQHTMFAALPTPMRIYAAVPDEQPCPVTVRDGRNWLQNYANRQPLQQVAAAQPPAAGGEAVISLEDVWFKYEQDAPDVVRGLSLTVAQGEFLAILGGNGAGKSTTLSLMDGLRKPYRGKVAVNGVLAALPQNPQALFVKKTVREDLAEILKQRRLSAGEREAKLGAVCRLCRLEPLLERHPYDLSGGEQQRAALAKVLLLEPQILLLDEPTKGLDAEFKLVFAAILQKLLRRGVTIVMVSHDIEFCACYAHRCALFFDGHVVTEGSPGPFFSGNSFYTTAANRMSRSLLPQAVTAQDVIVACGGKVPPSLVLPDDEEQNEDDAFLSGKKAPVSLTPPQQEKLPLWRKLLAGAAGAAMLWGVVIAMGLPSVSPEYLPLYGMILGAMVILALAVSRKSDAPIAMQQVEREHRFLSKRTKVALLMILLAVPLTIYVGVYFFGERKYYFISMLILLETMLPFVLVFEGRKPQPRELVVIAVLCTLGVAGRAVFFMLPQFKPVAALVIIAGVAFGGETGFLVGAVTMLVSNMLLSQGPWTPWQMFAMGVIGFLAGVLFRKGWLRRGRLPLTIFGALAALVVYGGLINPSFVVMYQAEITWPMLLTAYIAGFPFDLVHAIATGLFLWLLSQPLLEKLDRIKVKYGLIEEQEQSAPIPATALAEKIITAKR